MDVCFTFATAWGGGRRAKTDRKFLYPGLGEANRLTYEPFRERERERERKRCFAIFASELAKCSIAGRRKREGSCAIKSGARK